MIIRTALACTLGISSASAEELPHPELLVTTKAIHEKLAKETTEPGAMKAYQEKVLKAENATFEMLPVQGGKFSLGSPAAEAKRKDDEGPQKTIAIEPFWMGKLEVTWDLYRPFMENGKSRNKNGSLNRDSNITTPENPEIKEGETLIDTVTQPTPPYTPMHFSMGDGYSKEYPAVGVTQHAASKFCEWLTAQTGHFYRLPTEAEWEYACRAGTTTAYSFGDDPAKLDEYAWHAANSEFQYQKVGTRKPNPWGFHDMHGNVAELTIDQFKPDAYAAWSNDAVNPWLPPIHRYPTSIRGGHWNADPEALRSAARIPTHPDLKMRDPQGPKSLWYFTDANWLGFRVVRPLKQPTAEEMHRFWNTGPGATE